ncbi:hypothetical protein SK128_017090 [Halocaridina rubra]|uniref:WKF domain-containing protein n=1 Tax=Halocaridina rubra TaxID=373956 RepID=A0AAN8XRE4_HALRR
MDTKTEGFVFKNTVPHVNMSVKREKKKKKKPKKNIEYPKKTPQGTQNKQLKVIQYLNDWHTNRNQWKFQKNLDSWLVKHFYKKSLLGKAYFKIFLLYIADTKGSALKRCQERAQLILSSQESISKTENSVKTAKVKRAKQVLNI